AVLAEARAWLQGGAAPKLKASDVAQNIGCEQEGGNFSEGAEATCAEESVGLASSVVRSRVWSSDVEDPHQEKGLELTDCDAELGEQFADHSVDHDAEAQESFDEKEFEGQGVKEDADLDFGGVDAESLEGSLVEPWAHIDAFCKLEAELTTKRKLLDEMAVVVMEFRSTAGHLKSQKHELEQIVCDAELGEQFADHSVDHDAEGVKEEEKGMELTECDADLGEQLADHSVDHDAEAQESFDDKEFEGQGVKEYADLDIGGVDADSQEGSLVEHWAHIDAFCKHEADLVTMRKLLDEMAEEVMESRSTAWSLKSQKHALEQIVCDAELGAEARCQAAHGGMLNESEFEAELVTTRKLLDEMAMEVMETSSIARSTKHQKQDEFEDGVNNERGFEKSVPKVAEEFEEKSGKALCWRPAVGDRVCLPDGRVGVLYAPDGNAEPDEDGLLYVLV
ncbi:unnamed protein product, partial [Prorocentrum cordatum]